MQIVSARQPVWANKQNTAICLYVTFEGIGEVPFTASPDDVEPHGRLLFEKASSGLFGSIANFVPPPPPVPQAVSKFQARAALFQAGLLDAVKAIMEDPSTDPIVRMAWEAATEFQRNSPTVLAMYPALGLSDSQLDDMFRFASTIQA